MHNYYFNPFLTRFLFFIYFILFIYLFFCVFFFFFCNLQCNSRKCLFGNSNLFRLRSFTSLDFTESLFTELKIYKLIFLYILFRAFVSYSENINVDPNLEEQERNLSNEYQEKLKIKNEIVPDPLSIKQGWLGENSGIPKWPSIFYNNIANYLSILGKEFITQLEREYKLGKAYRYYTCKFLREVFYHKISDSSDYCILKCRVIPSHNTSMTPYFTWVICTKDKGDDDPGGIIHSAYCTCIAGLSGTCNHVTALLFRVDAAVTTGLTNPSKTSKLCQWNVPSGTKINLKPMLAAEMSFTKQHFSNVSEKDRQKEKEAYLSYLPTLNEEQVHTFSNEDLIRKQLYNAIKDDIKESRIASLIENTPHSKRQKNILNLPKTIAEFRHSFTYDKSLPKQQNVENFVSFMKITETDISNLKEVTVCQSGCTEWQAHRNGRITASNFHRVFSRANTLKKSPETNPEALVNTLLGLSKPPDTKSLRHGKAMEPLAKKKYVAIAKKKHKKLTHKESGLHLMKESVYIGASPDLMINCSCCGDGLVEIKCPYSIAHEKPTADNLSYLEKHYESGETVIRLGLKTAYYYQVQGQMGVTGLNFCDFFVFTKFGYHLERIHFDLSFWENLLEKLTWFWINYVAPAILDEAKGEKDIFHTKS